MGSTPIERYTARVLSGLPQRSRAVLVGAAGAVAAFFVFGGGRGGRSPADPFDTAPRDSFLVATIDLSELRRSPLYDVVFGSDGATAAGTAVIDAKSLGIDELTSACGFDPISRVQALAVAVPEEGDKGELGVAARATVTRDELSKCTSALAGRRGGKVDTREVGSFVVVETSPGEELARPRLAYGHGGLLVAGRGAWFDAMLSAADGKQPGAREATAHADMRASLESKDGWRAPTLLLSAVLPRPLRDRIKNEMGPELEAAKDGRHGPNDVMAGVLGVSTLGVALKAGERGQRVDAAVEMLCDTEEACAAVEKLLLKKRLDWSKELSLRMIGLGPLLDSIEVTRARSRIRVTAGTSADHLTATIDRLMRLRARPRERSTDSDTTPSSKPRELPPARRSDETIPAPRPSSSAH